MDIKFYFENRWFIEQFFNNCDLLLKRLSRFKTIHDKNSLDYQVYFENILISCRALFFESDHCSSNYTIRNFLTLINQNQILKEIDDFFNSTLITYGEDTISIRTGIKKITDKLLAHYDKTEPQDLGLYNLLYTELQAGVFNEKTIENIIQNTVFKTLNAWSNFTGFTSEKLNELKNSDFDEDD